MSLLAPVCLLFPAPRPEPRVSIGLPVFTEEQDIGASLEPLLQQSHRSLEPLISDKASTDATPRILAEDAAHDVTAQYLEGGNRSSAVREWSQTEDAPGNHVARLRAVRVSGGSGKPAEVVDVRQPAIVEMTDEVLRPDFLLVPNFHFFNEEGVCIFLAIDQSPGWFGKPKPANLYSSSVTIPGNLLAGGRVIVHAALITPKPVSVHFHERDAVAFIAVNDLSGNSARGDFTGEIPGTVRPLPAWSTTSLEAHRSLQL